MKTGDRALRVMEGWGSNVLSFMINSSMWRDELCLGFSSGFDVSLDMDRVMGRLGVVSIGALVVS